MNSNETGTSEVEVEQQSQKKIQILKKLQMNSERTIQVLILKKLEINSKFTNQV